MSKKLRIWNGRWGDRGAGSIYVAAHSVADAIAMVAEVRGHEQRGMANEISRYWSRDCWGNAMDGVPVERGVWIAEDRYSKPVRHFPKIVP